MTNNITGQNSAALLLLRIFLALLAVDAVTRVRKRVESLERDLLAAVVTLAEGIWVAVEPSKRLVDVPQEASFLTREQKRLFAFHRIGALVRHVEGIAAQIAVRRLRCISERFIGATKLLQATDIRPGTVSYLGEACGIKQTGYRDSIAVRTPDENEMRFFKLPTDGRIPVFEIFRVGYSQGGAIVAHALNNVANDLRNDPLKTAKLNTINVRSPATILPVKVGSIVLLPISGARPDR